MIIKQNNNRSPETVFVAFRNVGASSITQNDAVCYLISGASVTAGSGNFNAVQPVTAHLAGFGGVARRSVAVNGVGLATAYGYHASILMSANPTSCTIGAGSVLIPVTGTGGMNSMSSGLVAVAGGTLISKYAISGAALSTTTASAFTGWFDNCTVRAL